jgi:hypothetical protein
MVLSNSGLRVLLNNIATRVPKLNLLTGMELGVFYLV